MNRIQDSIAAPAQLYPRARGAAAASASKTGRFVQPQRNPCVGHLCRYRNDLNLAADDEEFHYKQQARHFCSKLRLHLSRPVPLYSLHFGCQLGAVQPRPVVRVSDGPEPEWLLRERYFSGTCGFSVGFPHAYA